MLFSTQWLHLGLADGPAFHVNLSTGIPIVVTGPLVLWLFLLELTDASEGVSPSGSVHI